MKYIECTYTFIYVHIIRRSKTNNKKYNCKVFFCVIIIFACINSHATSHPLEKELFFLFYFISYFLEKKKIEFMCFTHARQ